MKPTTNNHVVTWPSDMLRRMSKTTYEEAANRYQKVIEELNQRYTQEKEQQESIMKRILEELDTAQEVSQPVLHHRETTEVAVFVNPEGKYWVGAYSPHCRHQNGEPPFVLIRGMFDHFDDAVRYLDSLPKDAS